MQDIKRTASTGGNITIPKERVYISNKAPKAEYVEEVEEIKYEPKVAPRKMEGGGVKSVPRAFTPRDMQTTFRNYKTDTSRTVLMFGGFITLVLLGALFVLSTYVFDGATISIDPVKKDVALNETYIISEADRNELLQTREVGVIEEITLPKNVVKNVKGKSGGNVTIYNDFGTQAQKLLKNTRLTTSDGKVFKLVDGVTIPGKKGEKPGSVEAQVVAESEGDNYNVGPTKFSIPGLRGSPKYKGFYAESTRTMRGGSGNANEVSDLDLQKGKTSLKDKIKTKISDGLSKDVPESFTFNKDQVIVYYAPIERTKDDDLTATYTQVSTGTAIYMNKEALVKKILERTSEDGSRAGAVTLRDTKDFTISLLDVDQILKRSGPVTVTITGSTLATFFPNKQTIAEYFAGKPQSEFTDIAKKFQFIQSAQKTMRPFWASQFPADVSKIKVEYNE
jgi:hypothetical protein